ncbi:MAG: FtsX-like permease family protein [Bacteroidetes bacterium]|nr:FtsX-like permease family protein [Bacteroidota bacterium]
MIRNYFLIAIRSLWRNKLITLINLVGMAMAFGIFLSLWSLTRSELTFDKFHEDIEQMYVLNITVDMNGSEYSSERTGGVFYSLLLDVFPQVKSSCRISEQLEFELGVPLLDSTVNEASSIRYFDENEVVAVDSGFFHFFSFNLVKGDVEQVFTERNHLVLTKSLALKLFGDEDPMGREIRIGQGSWYKVVGVAEDPPEASTFQFSALVGFHVMEELGYPIDGHGGTIYYNNFKLDPGTDVPALNEAINEYMIANYELDLDASYFMDKLTRVHLYGESMGIQGLYLNVIIALVILLIGCINFINLTTAYASGRIREIFIRKSAGASKRQLITQFLGETYLLLMVALYLGFFLAEHLVPSISGSSGGVVEADFSGIVFWSQVVLVFLLTGLLAGLYPAVKIAGFRAPAFLSGKDKGSGKGSGKGRNISRRVLIVLQFTFSIIFVIVSIFVVKQFNHLKKADLGFNREDVIYIRTTGRVWEKYPQIKEELSKLHFVQGVTTGSNIPVFLNNGQIEWGDREGDHNKIAVILTTDADYLSIFQIDMVEGRFFYPDADSLNSQYVVVNQALVDLMEWEEPVGRNFFLYDEDYTILGVSENIDFFPYKLEVFDDKALIYRYESVREYVFIRTGSDISKEDISQIESIFQHHNPGYEFSCDFVIEYEYELLESSEGIRFIFSLFSIVAIFIAVMGVIGLSVFNHNRRTKEVGVRKAMGAHNGVIMALLLSDFMKLVVLSNVIGMSISYFIVRKILQFFSYPVKIEVSVFVIVFLLSLLLTIVTVSALAIRTARLNPVDSLRYE